MQVLNESLRATMLSSADEMIVKVRNQFFIMVLGMEIVCFVSFKGKIEDL